MQQKHQAVKFLNATCQDYAEQLRKQGHKQAAEVMAANCRVAIQTLAADESATRVPEQQDAADTD